MEKAREWLSSFNSNYQSEIQSIISTKSENQKNAITISVTGGKGGVGKTSVSLRLAKEFARIGKKILLIDCDTNLSNTAIKLGLPIDNSFYSLVSSEKAFSDCLHKDGNFHLLSACNGSIDLFDISIRLEEIIIDIINSHGHDYDYVLLDCPAGLSRDSLTLNAYCDKRIFVVTPDKSSVTDSYSLIKVLNKKFGVNENHILINKVHNRSQFDRIVKTLSETIENYLGCRTKILGGIKRINMIPSQFDRYFLEYGKNDLQQSFNKVMERLTEELSVMPTRKLIRSSRSKEFSEQEVH